MTEPITSLTPCVCGHAAGRHMSECTNGICGCEEFRVAASQPPSGDRMRDHPWTDAAGRPWSLKSESDGCFECGGTPDSHPRATTAVKVYPNGDEMIYRLASQPPSGDAPTRGHPEWVRSAAEYVVQLANDQVFDADEWDAAIDDLEAALASPGPVTEVFKP